MRLAGRLAVAGLLGAAGIAALQAYAAAGERTAAAARAAVAARPFELPGWPAALQTLRPGAARILLVRDFAAAGTAAPVVQVLADGALVLRRGAPRPDGPQAAPGGDAAIVLPGDLAGLGPAARAALASAIGRLCGDRPVPLEPFAAVGCQVPVDDLRRVLAWVP